MSDPSANDSDTNIPNDKDNAFEGMDRKSQIVSICCSCGQERRVIAGHSHSHSCMCPRCHMVFSFGTGQPEIRVGGQNANEVRDVAISIITEVETLQLKSQSKPDQSKIKHSNPWISGSFYLAAIFCLGSLFLVAGHVLTPIVLPVVVVASILGVSVIGALQLRNDDQLQQKSFAELMARTFQYLPVIRKRK